LALQNKPVTATQIRLGEDLYEYAKSESERLAVSLNYALIGLLDDGRRFRNAALQVEAHPSDREAYPSAHLEACTPQEPLHH